MKGQNTLKLVILVGLVFIESGYAQVGEEWVARYNGTGSGDDKASAIVVDASGNVYVTGGSVGANGFDYVTIKYDASGIQQWVARYNGPGNGEDMASAIALDANGNVYITGWSEGAGTSTDFTTIKYDSAGNQLWVARYNGPGNGWDESFALAVDVAGNVYVTGASVGASDYFEITTIKYDGSGNELWVRRYSTSPTHANEARAIAIDEAGNVFVTGWTQLGSDTTGKTFDFVTLKYSSVGDQEWVAVYNGTAEGCDRAYAIKIDAAGNVYVTGLSEGNGSGLDYLTVKYDGSGQQQWVSRYNGPGNDDDIALALELDATGNIYVTGLSKGSGTSWDYATIKYNAAGEEQWVSHYNGPGNADDIAFALELDAADNIYVAGLSWSDTAWTSADYATIKYNAAGEQQWVMRYDGPDSLWDEASALALDEQGNIYVTGVSYGDTITCEDYATIKYSQEVPIAEQEQDESISLAFILSSSVPNPFTYRTTIHYQLPVRSEVSLKIYNVIGRLVRTLVAQRQEAGYYRVSWDGRDASGKKVATGIYFYKLKAYGGGESYTKTRKLILIR